MFVPLHDTNPLKRIPYQWVTVSLIGFNTVLYLLFGTEYFPPLSDRAPDFALIPAEFLAGARLMSVQVAWLGDPLPVPEQFTIASYMFVHGSFLHLAGNMLFLWVFGDNVEDAMGHVRFLMFYVMCGVFAALTHIALLPESGIPLIGSSGAVAGIIAAYLMLHPRVKIWVLMFYRIPLRLTAAWVLGAWVVFQLFNAFTAAFGSQEYVAWWAHVGGLAAGAVLVLFMRRPGVPLFDRTAGGA